MDSYRRRLTEKEIGYFIDVPGLFENNLMSQFATKNGEPLSLTRKGFLKEYLLSEELLKSIRNLEPLKSLDEEDIEAISPAYVLSFVGSLYGINKPKDNSYIAARVEKFKKTFPQVKLEEFWQDVSLLTGHILGDKNFKIPEDLINPITGKIVLDSNLIGIGHIKEYLSRPGSKNWEEDLKRIYGELLATALATDYNEELTERILPKIVQY